MRGIDANLFASMLKLKGGRLARELTDSCLQFWGGMGFTSDVDVSRAFRDFRLMSIGGGADEVMLSIICKELDLLPKPTKKWYWEVLSGEQNPFICKSFAATHLVLQNKLHKWLQSVTYPSSFLQHSLALHHCNLFWNANSCRKNHTMQWMAPLKIVHLLWIKHVT